MAEPRTAWGRFLARPNDDRVKVFGIVALVALGAALTVSTANVVLRPLQEAHLEAERQARMQAMLATLPAMKDLLAEAGADALETRLVDLATGDFVEGVDAASYDAKAVAADPAQSVAIAPEADVAGLKARAPYAPVYLLERNGKLLLVILPVNGNGYQAPIRALLALDADLTTIAALTITEQADTPGLGAQIESREWQALWPGKQVTNAEGEIVISVVKGQASGPYEVDAISGATRTSNGVATMLRYWLGDDGYGPFLKKLREGAK
jgi:Na+-transporting NADH:ubiquinone oxidoreductase subunit C